MGYKICNSLVCQKRERYPDFYPHFAATEDDLIDHWISGVFTCTWLYDGLDDQNSSEFSCGSGRFIPKVVFVVDLGRFNEKKQHNIVVCNVATFPSQSSRKVIATFATQKLRGPSTQPVPHVSPEIHPSHLRNSAGPQKGSFRPSAGASTNRYLAVAGENKPSMNQEFDGSIIPMFYPIFRACRMKTGIRDTSPFFGRLSIPF